MSKKHTESGGKHYRTGSVQPWDLTRQMESSGNAHIDACRCNVIKYAFRLKGQGDEQTPKLLDDLRKAAHYIQEAVDCLTAGILTAGMDELPFAETPLPSITKSVNGHLLHTRETCKHVHGDFKNCPVCDWGLGICQKCGKAEAELEEHCTANETPQEVRNAFAEA